MRVCKRGSVRARVLRRVHRHVLHIDLLESRWMLSGTGILMPAGDHVARATVRDAVESSRTPSGVFRNEIESFQTNLENGPLLNLQNAILPGISKVLPPPAPAPAVIIAMEQSISSASNSFVSAVDGTASQFISTVNSQVRPFAPGIARLLKLQATALAATETQWADRFQVGEYAYQSTTPSDWPYYYFKDSWTTITQLTQSRPLWPLGTPALSLYQRADIYQHNLNFDVINMFSFINSGQSAFNQTTVTAHPYVVSSRGISPGVCWPDQDARPRGSPGIQGRLQRLADATTGCSGYGEHNVRQREPALKAINLNTGDPAVQASAAVSIFSSRIMTGNGLFGPQGPLRRFFHAPTNPFPEHAGRLYTSLHFHRSQRHQADSEPSGYDGKLQGHRLRGLRPRQQRSGPGDRAAAARIRPGKPRSCTSPRSRFSRKTTSLGRTCRPTRSHRLRPPSRAMPLTRAGFTPVWRQARFSCWHHSARWSTTAPLQRSTRAFSDRRRRRRSTLVARTNRDSQLTCPKRHLYHDPHRGHKPGHRRKRNASDSSALNAVGRCLSAPIASSMPAGRGRSSARHGSCRSHGLRDSEGSERAGDARRATRPAGGGEARDSAPHRTAPG